MTKKWYDIKAKGEVAELWLYDEIGEDWWTGAGITAKQLVADLNAIEASEIHVHLNSPGGSVFDGQAIYTALRNHPATVTSYVDGLAASIATVIMCAGEKVVMAENAMVMIHNPWSVASGSADDLRREADVLDKVGETMVGVYESKTGKTVDEVKAAMDTETWYTAAEALDFGLVDEVAGALKVAAKFDLSKFKHAPAALMAPATEEPAAPTPEPARDTTRTIDAGLAALLVTARRI